MSSVVLKGNGDDTKVKVVKLLSESQDDLGFVATWPGPMHRTRQLWLDEHLHVSKLKGREGMEFAYNMLVRPDRVHP